MKTQITAAFVVSLLLAAPSAYAVAEKQEVGKQQVDAKNEEAKPYSLKTCIASADIFGEMGKPVVFVHERQEIKLLCKDCRADLDKAPPSISKSFPKNNRFCRIYPKLSVFRSASSRSRPPSHFHRLLI